MMLYNKDVVKVKGVFIGDIVVLCKVGDVIFEVFGLVVEKCDGIECEFVMLVDCLECGILLWVMKEGDIDLCCLNVCFCFV